MQPKHGHLPSFKQLLHVQDLLQQPQQLQMCSIYPKGKMGKGKQNQHQPQQLYGLAFDREDVRQCPNCAFNAPAQRQRWRDWGPARVVHTSCTPPRIIVSPSPARPHFPSSFSMFSTCALQHSSLLSLTTVSTRFRDACERIQSSLCLASSYSRFSQLQDPVCILLPSCRFLSFLPLSSSCTSAKTFGCSSANRVFTPSPGLLPHVHDAALAHTPHHHARTRATAAKVRISAVGGPAAASTSLKEAREDSAGTATTLRASLSHGVSGADAWLSTRSEDAAASGRVPACSPAQITPTVNTEGPAPVSAGPRSWRNLFYSLTCLSRFSLTAIPAWKFFRGGAAVYDTGGAPTPCSFPAGAAVSGSLDFVQSPVGLVAAVKSAVPVSGATKYPAVFPAVLPFINGVAAASAASFAADTTGTSVVTPGLHLGGASGAFVDYSGPLVVPLLTGASSPLDFAGPSSRIPAAAAATGASATPAGADRQVPAKAAPDETRTAHPCDSGATGSVPFSAADANFVAARQCAAVMAPALLFAAAEDRDRASTASSPPAIADVPAVADTPSSTTSRSNHVLLRRLAADAIAAGAAGACVAPVVTIIDRSIVRRAAGVDRLWNSVFSGMQHMLSDPLRFVAGRDFRIVLGVYIGTYAAANGAESVALCYSNTSMTRTSADFFKFLAATAANMYLCIRKDIIFARLFGRRPATSGVPIKGNSNNRSTSMYKTHESTCLNKFSDRTLRPARDSESARRGDQTATSTNNNVHRPATTSNSKTTPAAAPGAGAPGATAPDTATSAPAAPRAASLVSSSAFIGGGPTAAPPGGCRPAVPALGTTAPASVAAGDVQAPKRFPMISTLLFVARDSLTIAASFNAPPYVANWILRAKKQFSAAHGRSAEGSEKHQHSHQQQHLQNRESPVLERQVTGTPAAADGEALPGKREREPRQLVGEEKQGRGVPAKDAAVPKTATRALNTEALDSAEADFMDPSRTAAGRERSSQTRTAGAAAATTSDAPYGGIEVCGERLNVEKKQNIQVRQLPQSSSAAALSVAQLVCPVAIQFVSTPLHLLSLDFFNHPSRTAGARWSFLLQTYAGTVAARIARILPAFGVGGIVNNYTRELLQQHLHASIAATAAG